MISRILFHLDEASKYLNNAKEKLNLIRTSGEPSESDNGKRDDQSKGRPKRTRIFS